MKRGKGGGGEGERKKKENLAPRSFREVGAYECM